MAKKQKTKPKAKPVLAWAMVDPEDMQILPYRIYEHKERNSGRGSITEGWRCIRVEIRPVKPAR